MKFRAVYILAAAIILAAVWWLWHGYPPQPTYEDRAMIVMLVQTRDQALIHNDASAYKKLFADDFQSIGNPMALDTFLPRVVEALAQDAIQSNTQPHITLHSEITSWRMIASSKDSRTIEVNIHSEYLPTVEATGFVVMFVRRNDVLLVSRMGALVRKPFSFSSNFHNLPAEVKTP
ncbi:MAG: hypothetical protein ABIO72_03670 [Patescibacteria group bacterium]